MTLYELMSWWWSLPFSSDIKSDSNVTHLLSDGVITKGVAILLVKCDGFLHRLWELYVKLNNPIDILLFTTILLLRDNSVSSQQHVIFPPVEIRLMNNFMQD